MLTWRTFCLATLAFGLAVLFSTPTQATFLSLLQEGGIDYNQLSIQWRESARPRVFRSAIDWAQFEDVHSLYVPQGETEQTDWKGLTKTVRTLWFERPKGGLISLDCLAKFADVETLVLSYCTITPELLKVIGSFPRLRRLSLRCCSGLSSLPEGSARLSKILELDLFHSDVSADTLSQLAGANLTALDVAFCDALEFKGQTCERFADLITLSVGGSMNPGKRKAVDLTAISKLKKLKHLRIECVDGGFESALKSLEGLAALESLALCFLPDSLPKAQTDQAPLSKLFPNLAAVEIGGIYVSGRELKWLREAAPQVSSLGLHLNDRSQLAAIASFPLLDSLEATVEYPRSIEPEAWKGLSTEKSLRCVTLVRGGYGDAEIQALASLRNLEVLRLGTSQYGVSSAAISALLQGAPDLKELSIRVATLTDRELAQLGQMKKLETLVITCGDQITMGGIESLAKSGSITCLHLNGLPKINGELLGFLAQLRNLHKLKLTNCNLPEAAKLVKAFSEGKLEELDVSGSDVYSLTDALSLSYGLRKTRVYTSQFWVR